MSTNIELLELISRLSPEDILRVLPTDVVMDLTTRAQENKSFSSSGQYIPVDHKGLVAPANVTSQEISATHDEDTPKRPLNAFIAFRSKYSKPDLTSSFF
jgi:hypothetical protein